MDDLDPATWRLRVMGLADMSGADTAPASAAPVADKKSSGSRKKPPPTGESTSGAGGGAVQTDMAMTGSPALTLGLHAIKQLPRIEIVTQLKCIEGWATVVRWAGARFADFVAQYPPETQSGNDPDVRHHPEDLAQYVSLVTPDGAYYVGLDMASALHPQTLLCYEMNGAPLSQDHGAPLRLVIPVKYGIKHLKRIGLIRYTNKRPADYWAEQGYDWYAGH
ncbi:MAG: molybdopterin-dependent oxidoreductase [Armatimonadetes bacterium]|nr:molybdopterin-dependent oxidoreductase [Armatimonadota bacterium]MDE2207192.1 molybdopterin-dependent oxidoreductase [Armatimonadota bacterium]